MDVDPEDHEYQRLIHHQLNIRKTFTVKKPYKTLNSHVTNGIRIRPGDTVRFFGPVIHKYGLANNRTNGYLHIRFIQLNTKTGCTKLNGWVLRDITAQDEVMSASYHELCMHVHVPREDMYHPHPAPHPLLAGLVKISPDQVFQQVPVIFTPNLSLVLDTSGQVTSDTLPAKKVCHRVWIHTHKSKHSLAKIEAQIAKDKKTLKSTETQDIFIRALEEEDFQILRIASQKHYREFSPAYLSQQYRGRQLEKASKYIMLDVCCGCGGASEGARLTYDIQVTEAVDCNETACRAFKANHPNTFMFRESLFDFLQRIKGCHVDVVHFSFPCQPYSQQQTRPGPNNEQIQATLFAVSEVLQVARPRIVTFEETSGITQARHSQYLHPAIRCFTDSGFSVHGRVVNFKYFGSFGSRKRFMLFAAALGERVPDFPDYTHGPGFAQPFRTVGDALQIVDGVQHHPQHRPNEAFRPAKKPRSRMDQLVQCIDTGGCKETHPSGRDFTLFELLILQGFPPSYKLPADTTLTDARRLIGNAFPPDIAKLFFLQVSKALRKADAERNMHSNEA